MTVKEHIIELVQSMPDGDDRLEAAERVLELNGAANGNGTVEIVDDPLKDCVPMIGDTSDLASLTEDMTEADWEEQRAHWRKVREQLKAEGADGSRYLPQLLAEAELEDAQAAASPE